MAFTVEKSPAEIIDFTLNWANDMVQNFSGDTLATSNWACDQAGLSIVGNGLSISNSLTSVKIAGGSDLITYLLTNTVTTVGGRTLTDTVTVICQQ